MRDVVVVGGGPAGTASSIFLKAAGHDVLLLDEARFPRDKVCGESVSPGAWRLLEALGVASAVRRLGPRPIRGMTLHSPAGAVVRGDYAGATGFALRRQTLDATLLECARHAGVEVHEETRVLDIIRAGPRVSGVVTEGGPIPARLVVGADGRRSVVARRLGLLREHPRLRKWAVRGHMEGIEGLEERGEMHVGGRGYCGIAPLSATEANIAFVLDASEMKGAGGDLEGFFQATLSRWPRVAERLQKARLLAPPKAIGPLALEARAVSAPGALLVGDSAGFFDPFTGEGVTLALRSAELATTVADRALRDGTPLREYDRLRHQATRDKFRLNRLPQHVVSSEALANVVGRHVQNRKHLADRLVSIAGDLVPARTAFGFWLDLLGGLSPERRNSVSP
jgi:geranylgeranyl reductase family protein